MEDESAAIIQADLVQPADGRAQAGPSCVEDLSGPDDYWLTLTDAARVTRRQEVTIRRWVAAGTLPVRNRTLGLNKRTRHVRASDLAKLSPIVDPSATISGATAQIDLLSIPVQQAEILAQHQQVQQQLQTLGTQLESGNRGQQQIEQEIQQLQTNIAGRFQQAEERHEAAGRQMTALKQSAQRLSGNIKEVQEEQKALRNLRAREVEQLRAFDQTQAQHLARIESLEKQLERFATLEKRQVEEVRERAKQQRRIDDLVAQQKALVATLGKVEKTLANAAKERRQSEEGTRDRINKLERSLTQLGEELRQQAAVASQQGRTLERALQEVDNRAEQLRDLLARQTQQLEQVTETVRWLATAAQTAEQDQAQASKPPSRKRRQSPAS
jgi:chromosome segregation ATPase